MQILFRSRKLERCYRESARGVREWGPATARKFIQRINILQAAKSLSDLDALPGLRCHPLKGRRAGRYAMNLDERWRLIFSMKEDQIDVLRIEEVSRHYGD